MKGKRALPSVAPEQTALGLPTIMDRELAAAHGVTYVHLAVFAIDVDRVYWLEPEHEGLPFGWEVFLTEQFLLRHLAGRVASWWVPEVFVVVDEVPKTGTGKFSKVAVRRLVAEKLSET